MTTIPAPKPKPSTHPHAHGHDDAHGHAHGHEHPAHLGHHWESLPQQFEAGKLGMWLFLATEVLLFGGLFCAYAVWRGNHPELFKYGSQFLDTTMGATNTVVLILSSLTMAWAVTAAQQNKQFMLKLMLILTLVGAATFMVIKYFEYTHKFHEGWYPGIKFYEAPGAASHTWVSPATAGEAAGHGEAGASEANGSATSIDSPAVAEHTAPMADVPPAQPESAASSGFEIETIAVTPSGAGVAMPPVEATSFPRAQTGPPGLAKDAQLVEVPFAFEDRHHEAHVHPLQDPQRPSNTHMFFNIYFMMTGLHGIHVLVGMIVIGWLLIRSFKGHFNSQYFTPVDLGGLYWHIVDLIWIFLFPLFYLI